MGGQVYDLDSKEIEVPTQFTDSISDLKMKQMSPTTNYLAASSWDGKVLVYAISTENMQQSTPNVNPGFMAQTQGPVLGICWEASPPPPMYGGQQQQTTVLYLAHSDSTIKRWDLGQQGSQPVTVGQHQAPVKDVYSFYAFNQLFVVSGGWDCAVKFFIVQNGQLNQVGESYVAKPVHFMSGCFPLLVTAHSEK